MNDPSELQPIFLRLPPIDIAMVKFVFEAYEGVAIVRTVDRHAAIIVVLTTSDFVDVARAIVADLRSHSRIPLEEIPRPADDGDDWFMRFLD